LNTILDGVTLARRDIERGIYAKRVLFRFNS
jgi:hypothetical protein